MICPKCGDNNKEDTVFCKGCGEYLSSQPDDSSSVTVVSEPVQDLYGQSVTQPDKKPLYGGKQVSARAADPQKDIFAVIGFILSFLSPPWCIISFVMEINDAGRLIELLRIGSYIAIVAVALSLRGLPSQRRALAVAGLVIGLVGFVLLIATMLIFGL